MPNWCSNSILIEGPKEKIKELWDKSNKDPEKSGLLEAMVPMPESEADNWYSWRVDNWGTKWEVNSEGLEYSESTEDDNKSIIEGWVDSAWGPPKEAFQKFCAENDDVYAEVHYHECGMGLVGYWDSEEIDEYYEYYEDNITSKNIREFIPEYIVDEWSLDEQLEHMEEDDELD